MANEDQSGRNRATSRFLPLSLRLQTLGGLATPLILRGTRLPTTRSETFSTAEDNQKRVSIIVSAGESPIARKNITIANFVIESFPKGKRGEPQIAVTFDVDCHCQIRVTAAFNGKRSRFLHNFEIPYELLGESTINRIVARASKEKDADEQMQMLIETDIEASNAIYKAEQMLRNLDDYLRDPYRRMTILQYPSGRKVNIQQYKSDLIQSIADIGVAVDSKNIDKMRKAINNLIDKFNANNASEDPFLSIFDTLFSNNTYGDLFSFGALGQTRKPIQNNNHSQVDINKKRYAIKSF